MVMTAAPDQLIADGSSTSKITVVVEDAGGNLVDHTGAQEELVADDIGVGRHLAQGLEEEFRDSHRAPRQKQRIGQGKRSTRAPPGV